MNIKAVGFDYGGVIAGLPSTQFNQGICAVLGISLQDYQNVYYQLNHLLNEKNFSSEKFWKKFCETTGTIERYKDVLIFLESLSQHDVQLKVIELVDIVRAKGFIVGMLSNNTVETANRLRQSGVADHFDVMLISAEIGCSKPSREAFTMFIDRLGIMPEELLFVDDTEKSLSTASDIGYYPVLYTDYASLIHEFKRINIL